MIKKIKKRNGEVVEFKKEKIVDAIYKATEAVGEPNYDLSKYLAEKVVERLEKTLKPREIPTVEGVQDIVEQVLVNAGQARVAKAYILYRQKRMEIRKQKQQILNKDEIDEVDKAFDVNALRVLGSRYLRKDENGKIIESPKQLFTRVAVHAVLPSLLFDRRVRKKNSKVHKKEDFSPEKYENKIKIGSYPLNRFHLKALKRIYDRFNERGEMRYSWSQFLKLLKNGEFDEYEKEIKEFYSVMVERKFMPNTPTLANFGNYLGMGSACFVLDIEDSIESIMDTLKRAALIFKAGGGVGYNFSKLRPEGDYVKSTGGIASGPVSFMSLFDRMTEVIKQGGIRRGANMGILNIDHPDIEKFITAKAGNRALRNFNISVFIKKEFWDYYNKNKPFPLVNPHTGKIAKYVDPKNLFDLIVYQAWESAEPGVIFDEHVNKYNPFLETLGPITTTNPCGEVLLYPYESCNLGSINVWSFVKNEPTNGKKKNVEFDWKEFERVIHIATRFLDNIVEINEYPLKENEEMTLKTRKIGLGMMGLADLLYELEIPYNSKKGYEFMGRLMEFLNYHSKLESIQLAKERGKFPYYNKSFYKEGKLPFDHKGGRMNWKKVREEIKKYGIRNAFTTVIAPTGSISMIAGCSSGIEPLFSLIFEKKVSVGSFYYVDPVFEKAMMREGLLDDELIREVSKRGGSIKDLSYIPERLKKIFVTAMDISAKDHIRALAVLQKWTDSSISKTINFPSNVTIKEMKEAYLFAHKMGCKDLTVFRDKSIEGVLKAGGENESEKKSDKKLISMDDVKAKGPVIYHDVGTYEEKDDVCPQCGYSPLIRVEGCRKCPNCGWSACDST
ncbi:MAG: adenosylcobalamin-dependent ribonucleoside-diphosphate reductase [Candidatus Aenigmarchaeota archaeon]|nr:adenosylcobalamin-dependent ribonucleoside-diphosphate reductase [Candidatus Aenigmarchaeota archaeon]